MRVSVIVCTHNPYEIFFRKTLEFLKNQSVSKNEWELIIIDNNSSYLLNSVYNLSWHPNSRIIREDNIGLTNARLRGISESRGDLLLFVDDDNFLRYDYIEKAIIIADTWQHIGAFGGSQIGEFEIAPEHWAVPLLTNLAVRKVDSPKWTNVKGIFDATPFGAGLCVRAFIAKAYAERCENSIYSRSLDRSGGILLSGGDLDMVWGACDMGYGMMITPELELTHGIKAGRVEKSHLIRQIEANTMSAVILHYIHNLKIPKRSFLRNLFDKLNTFRLSGIHRLVKVAELNGAINGHRFIDDLRGRNRS